MAPRAVLSTFEQCQRAFQTGKQTNWPEFPRPASLFLGRLLSRFGDRKPANGAPQSLARLLQFLLKTANSRVARCRSGAVRDAALQWKINAITLEESVCVLRPRS